MLDSTIFGGDATLPQLSDYQLIAAFREGEENAFAQLVNRYQKQLSGMCWRFLRDAHLVEDVVQESFLRLLETQARVDAGFNVSAWLHRIAVNLCLDELRRRGRQAEPVAGSEPPDVVDSDRASQPEEAYEISFTRETMRAAAQQLSPRHMSVFMLRDVVGLSQGEVATQLHLSPTAVQGILFRARERFRSEYVARAHPGSEPAACATFVFTLETLNLGALRRDRHSAVCRHLFTCQPCWARFGHVLVHAGDLDAVRRDRVPDVDVVHDLTAVALAATS